MAASSSLPGRSTLPSKIKKPSVDPSKGRQPSAGPIDGKVEELSFEEIRKSDQELRQLARAKTQKELEDIRKRRQQQELAGKQKSTATVSLSEIKTDMEDQQGGLPEHIAALAKDHPIRVRWEKGFRQRADGTWYKAYQPIKKRKTSHLKAFFFYWVPLILLAVGLLIGAKQYMEDVSKLRETIVDTVKKKGLALTDPRLREQYRRLFATNWIPDLERLLADIQKIPRNFDTFADNPEEGSYLEHIKRHNKVFNAREALEWHTKIIRKPH